MFKPCNMFSSNLTHHNNKWPNHSFNKQEFEEDSVEGSEVEEQDEVVNQSSAIPMGYLGITKESALIHSAHTVHPTIIMLKVSLN